MLIRVQYAGVNYIDTYFRNGTYQLQAIPSTAGQEVAGVLERLPTDPAVLNDPDFKARNYQVGQTVGFVCADQP
jgi:NADPH:quinone reductase